jgi:lipoprotein-releasing system permease protein
MYLNFAWRYFRAKKSTNAINIISWVSVTAIIIGTASLIIILSAFNGFEGLVKSLYSSFYTDLKVSPAKGKVMKLSETGIAALRHFQGVRAVSMVVEDKALVRNGDYQAIVYLKGVDNEYSKVAGVPTKIIRGRFDLGTPDHPGAVMGVGIENAIGVLADRSLFQVTVYMPRKGVADLSNPLESLSQGEMQPTGSFAIQSDFDNKYLLTNIGFVKDNLLYAADEYSAAEIALADPERSDEAKAALQQMLGPTVKVEDRYEQNRSLYTTIRLEKWAIYAIFSLILLVAAFNMIGALSMLVLEKKKDIQVLQAMGASESLVRKIFLSEGLLLAFIGATGGMVVAFILYYLQIHYKLVPIKGESFLIDYYPVRILPGDLLLVAATVFVIGLLASWFPAMRAAKQPFELRN